MSVATEVAQILTPEEIKIPPLLRLSWHSLQTYEFDIANIQRLQNGHLLHMMGIILSFERMRSWHRG